MTAYSTALLGKAKAASQIFSNCCDLISVLRKLFELGPGGKPNIQFSIPDDEIQEVRWTETWITGITSLHLKQIPNHWPEKWFNFSLKVISAVFRWHWSAVAATTLKRSSSMKPVYKTARQNVISESRCTARWKKKYPTEETGHVTCHVLHIEFWNLQYGEKRDWKAQRRKFFCREWEESYSVRKSRAEDNTINPKKEGVEDGSKCSGTGQHAERQRETALNTRTSGRSKLSEKQKRSSSWLSFNDADYKAECRICTLKKSVYNK